METKVKRVGADFRTGTIAYYGPDDKTVTKVIVGITVGDDGFRIHHLGSVCRSFLVHALDLFYPCQQLALCHQVVMHSILCLVILTI